MLVVGSTLAHDDHRTPVWHPDQPARLRAAHDGLIDAGLMDAIVEVRPRPATASELHRVHASAYVGWLEERCAEGREIDADTFVSAGSWDTALLAAGVGLQVIEGLDEGLGEAGLVLVRPPGHHAGRDQAMGFCLLNNVAVAAAAGGAR